MIQSTRIGRKILVAILIVATGPLIGAFVLGQNALRDVYTVGVNPRFRDALDRGVDAHRDRLLAMRELADRTADSVANHHDFLASLEAEEPSVDAYLADVLERYDNVGSVTLRHTDEAEVIAYAEEASRLDESTRRVLERSRELRLDDGRGFVVDVVLSAPRAPFEAFQEAGEVAEVYSRLERQSNLVSDTYFYFYFALVAFVIFIAAGLGLLLSRRVTRRVAALARATQRVGAGDLTVTVPTGAADEVGELTLAFNDMVRDLRESRERIDYLQRIGAWQEFARRLAHEIKNPLTPIQLATQEIHRSYAGDDEAFRTKLDTATTIVEEEVATLRRLVGEFSSFAKLPQAVLDSSDLREFLDEIERSVPGILEDAGAGDAAAKVQVHVSAGGAALPVHIDTMMLRRCVDNLVRNAVQAVVEKFPDGGGQVWVEAEREDRKVRVEVSDNGPGIASQDRARVFDPYFTTKSEGTGLGLAIVKKVVLEHEGEIRCERGDDGGARFVIRLPLRRRVR